MLNRIILKGVVLLRRLDDFCARLNFGLAAVAAALFLVVAVEAAIRLPAAWAEAQQLNDGGNLPDDAVQPF